MGHVLTSSPIRGIGGSSCASLLSLSVLTCRHRSGFRNHYRVQGRRASLRCLSGGISALLACIPVCMQSGYALVPHLLDGCGNIPKCGFRATGINLTSPALNSGHSFMDVFQIYAGAIDDTMMTKYKNTPHSSPNSRLGLSAMYSVKPTLFRGGIRTHRNIYKFEWCNKYGRRDATESIFNKDIHKLPGLLKPTLFRGGRCHKVYECHKK